MTSATSSLAMMPRSRSPRYAPLWSLFFFLLNRTQSPFLDLLFKYQCIRTQKKQKVFYWYSVPHDRLFLDALDRDLKREKMGHPPTTHVVGEPALSFTYDPKRTLYDQYAKKSTATELESDQDADLSESDTDSLVGATGIDNLHIDAEDSEMSDPDHLQRSHYKSYGNNNSSNSSNSNVTSFFSNLFGIFEGSPTYKQRRKKGHAQSSLSRSVSRSSSVSSPHIRPDDLVDRGRSRNIASGYHHPGASLSRERSQPYPSPYSHIHRQHSLPHLPPTDAPFHYDEIPTDTTPLFHQQATGDLMPIDRYTRKSLPDVNPIISHGFTAQQQTLQQSNPFSVEDSSIGYDTFPAVSSHSSPGLHYDIDHKHRAHTCPLISCNKLFKRTEHLKRHLRTHTLEKPFICPVCHKHFSRRDNLNQHIKIHDRSDGTIVGLLKGDGAQEMEGLDDPINTMSTGPEMNTLGALSGLNPATVGMWREGSEDSDLSGAESEGFADDGIGFFDQRQQHVMDVNAGNTAATATADPMFIGVGASNVGGASGMSGGLGDIQMEDEIPRGSEEEMMQPHAHTLQYAAVTQNFAPDSVLWAQQSPAFPSPSQQQHARHTSRSSMPGSPVGMIARHNHSSSSSTSSLSAFGNGTGSGDEFGTSMSLPLYERPGMYTSGVVAETGNATGAGAGSSTRRPRSMTPSLFGRGVEESGIRRPLSSVSSLNESGVNGNRSRGESGGGSERPSPVPMISSMNMAGGQRVYHHQHQHHPYVNSGSRGGSSTHSSPAVYNVSLGNVHSAGGESVQQPTHPSHQHQHQHQHQQQQQQDGIQGGGGGGGSESRTSFNDEQEMFGISQQHPMTTYHQHSHHSHHHHHQQQQPLTESPLPYTIELPQQQQQHWNPHHHHHHHHHHRDVMNMVGAYDSSQQQQ